MILIRSERTWHAAVHVADPALLARTERVVAPFCLPFRMAAGVSADLPQDMAPIPETEQGKGWRRVTCLECRKILRNPFVGATDSALWAYLDRPGDDWPGSRAEVARRVRAFWAQRGRQLP